MKDAQRTVLVTGFPKSFLAGRIVAKIVAEEAATNIVCVTPERWMKRAEDALAALPTSARRRVSLLEGDSAALDLGLSGEELRALTRSVDVIHHCAAVTYLGVERRVAEQVNVGGAREILEVAEICEHLERLVFWSTALVSGNRRGYVLEDELRRPESFRNVIEETRFQAEQIVRASAARVPTTILRPAVVVGDSETGEIDRFEGPYLLVLLMLNSPVDLRMPMPGRGDVPLNLVPADFVVDAGYAIARSPETIGRCFHIVDPDPRSAKQVFELIAEAAGRPMPRGFLPTNLATALLRTPGLERFAHVPRAFLEQLATEVVYDARNANRVLGPAGIHCPSFDSYVRTLVEFVRQQQSVKRRDEREAIEGDDPLA